MDGWKLTAEGSRIMSILEEMSDREIDVGFVDGAENDEGVSLAEIAAFNEFGTIHIPARPFMHDAIEFNRDKIQNHLSKDVKKILTTGTGSAQETLSSLGAFTQRLIQREIKDGMWQPNAPATVRKKHSDKPLIDTGRMRQSVHYVIK